jgi:type IV/VI secretion system ImpK/VasF family protein
MATLRELFSKVFAYVLLFGEANREGQPQRSYEEVRDDITGLLEQAKAASGRQKLSDRDYEDACFAVVAWVDETIVKSSWQHRNRWDASPLQLEYFQTRNAGESLFERLEKLGLERKEVREVYYHCLGLGFSGQYFVGLEDELRLNQIRHKQAHHLPLPVEEIQGVKKITPQPYDVPAPGGSLPPPPWTRLLLRACLVLLVVVPVALFLLYTFLPVAQVHLTVAKAGGGSGSVVSAPAGIRCGPDCSEAYARGTAVALTATPDAGSVFHGWSGDPGCASGVVSMTASKTCTAAFHLELPTHQLVIAKAGSGGGTVTSAPAGVSCGTDCSQAYASGTSVTLQAVPDPDSTFAGWSGDAECLGGQVSMTADRSCKATFHIKLEEVIRARLAGQLPCAKVLVDAVDVQTGSVRLTGRVASEGERAKIYGMLQEVKGVTKVEDSFQIIPRPFCEVVEILEPFKEQNDRLALGLTARLNKPGGQPIYTEGDNLVIQIKVPGQFESYLYVDYYATDGQVGHMFPDPYMFPEPWKKIFTPHSSLAVDGGPKPWRIQGPFGLELVTVIASKGPLFPAPRKAAEPVEPYINELRQALPKDVSKSEVTAELYFITTKAR